MGETRQVTWKDIQKVLKHFRLDLLKLDAIGSLYLHEAAALLHHLVLVIGYVSRQAAGQEYPDELSTIINIESMQNHMCSDLLFRQTCTSLTIICSDLRV